MNATKLSGPWECGNLIGDTFMIVHPLTGIDIGIVNGRANAEFIVSMAEPEIHQRLASLEDLEAENNDMLASIEELRGFLEELWESLSEKKLNDLVSIVENMQREIEDYQ